MSLHVTHIVHHLSGRCRIYYIRFLFYNHLPFYELDTLITKISGASREHAPRPSRSTNMFRNLPRSMSPTRCAIIKEMVGTSLTRSYAFRIRRRIIYERLSACRNGASARQRPCANSLLESSVISPCRAAPPPSSPFVFPVCRASLRAEFQIPPRGLFIH